MSLPPEHSAKVLALPREFVEEAARRAAERRRREACEAAPVAPAEAWYHASAVCGEAGTR